MARIRLTALTLLISAAVIGVGVADYIGAVFALSVFAVYAVFLLLLPFSMFGFSAKVSGMPDVSYRNTNELRLVFTRRNVIPCGAVRLKLKLYNHYTGETAQEDLILRLPKRGETEVAVTVSLPHVGKVSAEVTRAWVYDLTGLFALPRGLEAEGSCFVLPQPQSARIGHILPEEAEDSRAIDPNRPGDSRPELFGVHEYMPGDALRDVHWKLTARLDKMMVREFVRPLNKEAGVLFINGGVRTPEQGDLLTDTVASLSLSLIESGMPHTLTWCENGKLRRERIADEEELFAALRQILAQPLCGTASLCAGLHQLQAAEPIRMIAAAADDERVIEALPVYANDRLLFAGTAVPPLFSQRIVHHAAVGNENGIAQAIGELLGMGVRL